MNIAAQANPNTCKLAANNAYNNNKKRLRKTAINKTAKEIRRLCERWRKLWNNYLRCEPGSKANPAIREMASNDADMDVVQGARWITKLEINSEDHDGN